MPQNPPAKNNPPLVDNSHDERTWLAQLSLTTSPLPPPEILEKYDRLAPGSVQRLINMAEDEQKHRHRLDLLPLELKAKEKRRGQWMGFSLALAVLMLAVWLVTEGFAGLATTIVSGVFVAIAAVFVLDRHPASKK